MYLVVLLSNVVLASCIVSLLSDIPIYCYTSSLYSITCHLLLAYSLCLCQI